MSDNLMAVGDAAINAELARRVADARPVDYEPPLPLPEARVPWRPANELELASCSSAASLLRKARAAGWAATAWFASGPYIGADGQPLGAADGLALLFRWRTLEAYATWYRRDKATPKWELEAAYQLGPVLRLGGNELGHWLCGTEPKQKKEAA